MKNYYFIFASNHYRMDGDRYYSMRDYWVRVIASSSEIAKRIFRKEFADKYMVNGYWMCMKVDRTFKRKYYPLGEFAIFKEE